MSYFEELKEAYGQIRAAERYSYASTSRVYQGARYGDSIILDQFADQMRLNSDPMILQALADDIAVMTRESACKRFLCVLVSSPAVDLTA